jgi:hypothetical protein
MLPLLLSLASVFLNYIDNEYGVHAAEMVDKWISTYEKDGFALVAG